MLFPLRLVLALFAWQLTQRMLIVPEPSAISHSLPQLSLAVSVFLLCHGAQLAVETWILKPGTGRRLRTRLDRVRVMLPLGCHMALLAFARWDALVVALVPRDWLLPTFLLALGPFLVFESLAVLGELLVRGNTVMARIRAGATWTYTAAFGIGLLWVDVVAHLPWTRAAYQELLIVRITVWCCAILLVSASIARLFVLFHRTRAVESPLVNAWMDASDRAGFAVRRVLAWQTQARVAAMRVFGTLAGRDVVVSDALHEGLASAELEGVFARELAATRSAQRVRLVLFAVLLPCLLGVALHQYASAPLESVGAWFQEYSQRLPDWLSSRLSVPPEQFAVWKSFGFALFVSIVLLVWLSRRFEREADLEGSVILGDTEPLASAIRVLSGGGHDRRSERRLAALEAWKHSDPGIVRWRRRAPRVQAQLFLLLGLAAAAQLPWFIERLQSDHAGFLIARGEFREAFDSWSELEGDDERGKAARDQLKLATRGVQIRYEDSDGPDELRARAVRRGQRDLIAGRLAAAHDWFRLAVRLGESDRVVRAISAYLSAVASEDLDEVARADFLLRLLPVSGKRRTAVATLLARRGSG